MAAVDAEPRPNLRARRWRGPAGRSRHRHPEGVRPAAAQRVQHLIALRDGLRRRVHGHELARGRFVVLQHWHGTTRPRGPPAAPNSGRAATRPRTPAPSPPQRRAALNLSFGAAIDGVPVAPSPRRSRATRPVSCGGAPELQPQGPAARRWRRHAHAVCARTPPAPRATRGALRRGSPPRAPAASARARRRGQW